MNPSPSPSRTTARKGLGESARVLYHADASWRMACEIFLIGLLTMVFASGPKSSSAQAPTTYQKPTPSSQPPAPAPASATPTTETPQPAPKAVASTKPITVTSQQLKDANLPPDAEVLGSVEIKPTRSLEDAEVIKSDEDDFGVFKYGSQDKALKPSGQ